MVHIYNRPPINHRIRQNTAIYDNMVGSREYHSKQNKSDRKSQVPYDFTHMKDIILKATNEQRQRLIDTENSMVITRGERGGRSG